MNSTTPSSEESFNTARIQWNTIIEYIQLTFAGYFSTLVFFIVYFIIAKELPARNQPRIASTLFSIPNVLIMLLSMNMSLFFATNAFYNTTRDSVLGQLTTLSLNCGQVIFAYYSWLRGYEVFKLQVSATMIKCLRGMLCFIPVVSLGPNIVLLLGLPIQIQVKWFLITGAICAGSTISTDFVFSYSYIRHIWKMRCQKMDVKQQYYVISVYGLSANVFAFLALLCFVVMQLNAPSATPTMKALVINCIATMLFSCFLAVSVTLLVVMKVALVRPSVLSGQRSNGSAVKRFLEVTSRDDGSRLIANP